MILSIHLSLSLSPSIAFSKSSAKLRASEKQPLHQGQECQQRVSTSCFILPSTCPVGHLNNNIVLLKEFKAGRINHRAKWTVKNS